MRGYRHRACRSAHRAEYRCSAGSAVNSKLASIALSICSSSDLLSSLLIVTASEGVSLVHTSPIDEASFLQGLT